LLKNDNASVKSKKSQRVNENQKEFLKDEKQRSTEQANVLKANIV